MDSMYGPKFPNFPVFVTCEFRPKIRVTPHFVDFSRDCLIITATGVGHCQLKLFSNIFK